LSHPFGKRFADAPPLDGFGLFAAFFIGFFIVVLAVSSAADKRSAALPAR